jgi:hypothetical protein
MVELNCINSPGVLRRLISALLFVVGCIGIALAVSGHTGCWISRVLNSQPKCSDSIQPWQNPVIIGRGFATVLIGMCVVIAGCCIFINVYISSKELFQLEDRPSQNVEEEVLLDVVPDETVQ